MTGGHWAGEPRRQDDRVDDERSALVVALLDSLEGSADPSLSEAWRDEVRDRGKALHRSSPMEVELTTPNSGYPRSAG